MAWFRLKTPYDAWTPKDVGKLFEAEGTTRMLMLEHAGYVEQLVGESDDLGVQNARPSRDLVKGEPAVATRRKGGGRGKPGANRPAEGEAVRPAAGDAARGEDGAADRGAGEAGSSGS